MLLILPLLTISCLIFLNINGDCEPLVKVEHGLLLGTDYSTTNGRVINAFLGIPYAAPPVNENRFKEPQPVTPWPGIWNASYYGSRCLQYYQHPQDFQIVGEEDCLFLNVYTPKLPDKENSQSGLMDVLVYIHGGCFMFGTGNVKTPDYLLDSEDIVFVTINYRLGPIGFFSTGDEVVPGNNGLKDQVAALKWIQRNIASFGGNPSSVTISGMSAGGASIHYHYLSPLSEGLFHRGISQSGSVLAPWVLPRGVAERSKEIASRIGCPTDSSKHLVECLQNRPALQLLHRIKEYILWRYNPYSPIGPVVEKGNKNAFLPEEPIKMLISGKIKNLPWLASTTTEEGLYPAADFLPHGNLLKELDTNWNHIAPHILQFDYIVPKNKHDRVSNAVRDHYIKDALISESTKELVQMIGDRLFVAYVDQSALYQARVNTAPVYYYKFAYRGKYSLANWYSLDKEDHGVSHGDDTQYLLGVHYSRPTETKADRDMIKIMVDMWISYVKTGIPSIGKHINWTPVSRNMQDFNYLLINSPTDLQTKLSKNSSDLFQFWNSVIKEFPDISSHDEF